MKKSLCALICLIGASIYNISFAQERLSLEDCRNLAKENSKLLQIKEEGVKAAYYNKKAAFTKYLPHISASGSYLRNEKEFSLLGKDKKEALGGLGAASKAKIDEIADIVGVNMPQLKPLLQSLGNDAYIGLNKFSDALIDGLRTDSRNVYVGAISLTQPLYMGGKIRAYNQITKHAELLAKEAHQMELRDVILSVDESYWQVVSLTHKEKIALAYLELLQKLEENVNHLIDEGLATKADGLTIRVKVNEGEMTLMKVQDGLVLARMLLYQICGIDLNSEIQLVDEGITDLPTKEPTLSIDINKAYADRPEIKSLELATQIFDQKIKLARSESLPQLALMANYLATNPSVFNGFENKFRGMWSVGVSLKVPIWSWGEGYYKTKSARSDAQIARLELAEAKEKIELQINQSAFKVNEANKKLNMALSNMAKADENLAYAKYGFEEGVIPVNNVLEAHTAWLSAQSDKIDAQIDIKLTQIYFNNAMGKLTE